MVAALFVAYALFGYLTDDIRVFIGKGRPGPRNAHGEQAAWAALGYLSFAIAAAVVAIGGFAKPTKRIYKSFSLSSTETDVPQPGFASSFILAILFAIIGIILVGFRTPG